MYWWDAVVGCGGRMWQDMIGERILADMNLVKNDLFQVRIDDLSDTGEGIGKVDGFTWFIKDAIIGDVVEAKVMKTKKSYGFARLIRVMEPSPYRVEPRCKVARQCGGCQLQAMDYQEQLHYKENKVLSNLKRIGGFSNLVRTDVGAGVGASANIGGDTGASINTCSDTDAGANTNKNSNTASNTDSNADGNNCVQPGAEVVISVYPIIGMDEPWRYRNKAQFPFGRDKDGKIITGFYAGRTHSITPQEDCLLGVEENQLILSCVKKFMEEFNIAPYDEENHRGIVRHALIRKGFQTGELMVCLVVNGSARDLKKTEVLVERLVGLFGAAKNAFAGVQMASISVSSNQEKTNVIMGTKIENLYGSGYITDYIGNVQYRISPLSFYQVNPIQTEKLYRTALEYADLTGEETVWDLYCGIGTISLFLARKAKQVYGVEIVPQAIEDARANAKLNDISNVEFFVGRAEEVLPEQYEKNREYADVIVVDPPRKGCDEGCLDTIVRMAPRRVVYVSCDSATLARDLKWLCGKGYWVEKVQMVDMFPASVHCEIIVEVCRK